MTPQPDTTEVSQWLASIRAGRQATERLLEHYRPLIETLVSRAINPGLRRRIGESGVVQLIWVRLWQRLDTFTGQSQGEFEAWLRTLVERLLVDETRKVEAQQRDWRREESPPQGSGRASTVDRWIDREASPSEILVSEEDWARFWGVLALYPTRQRVALVLRIFQKLSYEDIGRALGCTTTAAQSIFHRARRRLIAVMGQPGDPDAGQQPS